MNSPIKYIIVFGVAGSGKTTVGKTLAEKLKLTFIEGDDLHPQNNIAKMKSGYALNDGDRIPWLHIIVKKIKSKIAKDEGFVLSCSALKLKYRNILRQAGDVTYIFLSVDKQKLEERLASRVNHFIPASLLESQIKTLELPTVDEVDTIAIDASLPLGQLLVNILSELKGETL